MFVRFLGTFILLSASTAVAANQMSVAIGSSVPMAAEYLILKSGPSRASGGERFIVKFAGARPLTAIKISAFSTARTGKALIHNAIGMNGTAKTALDGLYKFGAPSAGNPTNSNGKNMLTDSSSVEIALKAAFTQLEFTIEGYTNDDASVLLQITSADDLEPADFLVTRTGPKSSESVGGLIDESRYAKFTPAELRSMMASAKSATAFEVTKPLAFNLKNVGETPVGPQSQPMSVAISWSSKTIPGSDVYLSLSDGKKVSMEKPAYISNLTIPAKGATALVLDLLVRNRKLLSGGSGNLRISLRLPDRVSGSDDTVQTLDLPLSVELDMKAIEWNQIVKLNGMRIQCQFPNLEGPTQEIAFFEITKKKGSDRVEVRAAVPGSTESAQSPVIAIPGSRILPYYQQFIESWTPQTAVEFLNKLVAPNTPRGTWSFKACEVRARPAPPLP